ncbi:MAG: DUF998 domain-containing protein [Caldilineaceae bacterium]
MDSNPQFPHSGSSSIRVYRWLAKGTTSRKAPRGGIIALLILALLFFLSGLFVMDPAGTPTAQLSVHGLIHGLAGGIVFLLMPITIFLFLRHMWADRAWASIRIWTCLLFLVEALGVIVFTYVSKLPVEKNLYLGWLGLLQRVALIPFMVWLCLFGVAQLKRQR